MNIVQYIAENSPIQNVADLMNIHHGNPLGLSPLVQLLIIFVLVEVMDVFNNLIRYRDQQQHYPKVYVLLGLSLVAVFYYCFQSGMPILKEGAAMGQPSIGWFCRPGNVGWPLAILSWVLLSHVIYCLLNAVMQATAQLTVESGFVDNKPWNEVQYAIDATRTAILGRTAMETGDYVTMEQMMTSTRELVPNIDDLRLDGPSPAKRDENGNYEIGVPGVTKFV